MDESLRICAVIPSYNHSARIQWIVDKLLENNLDVIMVDEIIKLKKINKL